MSHFYGQDNVVTKNPQPQKVQNSGMGILSKKEKSALCIYVKCEIKDSSWKITMDF